MKSTPRPILPPVPQGISDAAVRRYTNDLNRSLLQILTDIYVDLLERVTVRKNTGATDVGAHYRLNFIAGDNITLTVEDDTTDDEVDITIAASGGSGIALSDITEDIEFVMDGQGSAITTGLKGFLVVDYACTIQAATLVGDVSGSIVLDVWKDAYANHPPADADSITASAPPTISSATKSKDTTLTGWTTAIAAGDVLAFNVDSCSTITQATLALKVVRV